MLGGLLGVGQLRITAVIAALRDDLAGLAEGLRVAKEAGAVEVDVGQEEAHGAALGELAGFVQVGAGGVGVAFHEAQPGAGEEAAHHEFLFTSSTKTRFPSGCFRFSVMLFFPRFRLT